MRPDTMVDGFASRDRSFMVSLGLLIGGRIEGSLSNSLPIWFISPGVSSRAGGAGVEGGGPCSCKPSGGDVDCGDADCGHPVPPAPSRSNSAAEVSVPSRRAGLPDRTIMTATVAEAGAAAKRRGTLLIEHDQCANALLDQLDRDHEAQHEHRGANRHPQSEVLFDPDPDPVAIAVEQDRHDEKTSAARNDRAQDEQADIVA